MTLGISVIVPRGCVTAMTRDSGCGGGGVLLWGGFGVDFQQQQQSLELNRRNATHCQLGRNRLFIFFFVRFYIPRWPTS